ncbi:MAG: recombinase RecA [Opitutae bacterium]|nr:recombinase RecA [Opitutae bacterium]
MSKATKSDARVATSEKSANPAREKNIELAVSSITKQFGEGSIMRLGSNQKMKVETLSTGSLAIDLALGVGGLPKGRIVEIYGPESSGKTTFCLSVIAEAQRKGGLAAFIDVEHALDPKYAKVVGVSLDDLLVSQPDSGEDALNIMETLIRSNSIDIIVLDSVAALITKAELDGQMGDMTMGSQARLMSQAMRRLTSVVSKTNCVCIFTNQIREKIGVMFGNPETTSGGRALKFFSSIRIDIRRKDQLKTPDGKVIGNRTKIKVVKNKVAPPFTEVEFDIMYDEGISTSGSLIDLGLDHKVLEKKGAWIAFNGELVGQGREAAKEAFRTNAALAAKVTAAIMEKRLDCVRTQSSRAPANAEPNPAGAVPASTLMRPALPRLLLVACLAAGPAFAAKKEKPKAEPADAPPQLISTKGGGPKWTTVEQLRQFAAKGDPQACLELGDRTLEGDGVPRDVPAAAALFEQAAKGGVANGWFRLGKIYHDGLAGAPDYGRALDCFTTSARAGLAEAQHNIGAMLVSARGVKRDYVEGLAWLIVAKKSGAASDAETQVRARIAKRPADITTAEARATEIARDIPHATVRATLLSKPAASATPAVQKPVIAAPKPEPVASVKITVPLMPAPPPITPGKP